MMSIEDTYLGFSTDEENLVKLGFQTASLSDSPLVEIDDNSIESSRKRIKRNKNYFKNLESYYSKDVNSLLDEYEDMDETEFNKLFQFENKPIFCSKDILKAMNEYGMIDCQLEDQENLFEEFRNDKKKRKKRRKLKQYSLKKRFNRIGKSLKYVLMKIENKHTQFVRLLETELVKFIESEETEENDKIYIRFFSDFHKYLAMGICNYYLLYSKNYDSKRVIVIKRTKKSKMLPQMSLINYLFTISPKLQNSMKKEEEKKGNIQQGKPGNEKNLQHTGKPNDSGIYETEYFSVGKVKKRK